MLVQSVGRISEEVLTEAARAFQHNLTGRLQALLPASIASRSTAPFGSRSANSPPAL
jgi:hypothetical protein